MKVHRVNRTIGSDYPPAPEMTWMFPVPTGSVAPRPIERSSMVAHLHYLAGCVAKMPSA